MCPLLLLNNKLNAARPKIHGLAHKLAKILKKLRRVVLSSHTRKSMQASFQKLLGFFFKNKVHSDFLSKVLFRLFKARVSLFLKNRTYGRMLKLKKNYYVRTKRADTFRRPYYRSSMVTGGKRLATFFSPAALELVRNKNALHAIKSNLRSRLSTPAALTTLRRNSNFSLFSSKKHLLRRTQSSLITNELSLFRSSLKIFKRAKTLRNLLLLKNEDTLFMTSVNSFGAIVASDLQQARKNPSLHLSLFNLLSDKIVGGFSTLGERKFNKITAASFYN